MEIDLKHGGHRWKAEGCSLSESGKQQPRDRGPGTKGRLVGVSPFVVFLPHTSLGRITAYPIILVGSQSH